MKRKGKIVGGRAIVKSKLCVNCCQSCTSPIVDPENENKRLKKEEGEIHYVNEILIDLNKQNCDKRGEGEDKINVNTALSLIYKLNVVNGLNLDGKSSVKIEDIVVCERCSEVLQTLFILFDEFQNLRKEESYLARKVSQLDELLIQLQETWTEMANLDESQDDEDEDKPKIKDIDNDTHISSDNNYDDDDDMSDHDLDDVVIIQQEPINVNKLFALPNNNKNQDKDIIIIPPPSQQQQKITTVPSSSSKFNLLGAQQQENKQHTTTSSSSRNFNFVSNNTTDFLEDETEYEDITVPEQQQMNNILPSSNTADQGVHLCTDLERRILEEIEAITSSGITTEEEGEIPNDDDDYDPKLENEILHHSGQYGSDSDWGPSKERRLGPSSTSRARAPRAGRRPFIKIFDSCPVCSTDVPIPIPSDRSDHFFSHHPDQRGKRLEKCLMCDKKFSTHFSLKTHLRGHAGDLRYKCSHPSCGRCFLTGQQLDMHVCIADGGSPSASTGRKKQQQSRRKSGVNNGEKSKNKDSSSSGHQRVQIYETCPLCPDNPSFSHPREFSNHLWVTHRTSGDEKDCMICQKILAAPASLLLHLRAHAGDLRYECSICTRAFLTSQQLEIHTFKKHGTTTDKELDVDQSTNSSRTSSSGPSSRPYKSRMKHITVYNTCPLCPEGQKSSFAFPSDLSHHWWDIHRTSLNDTTCPLCVTKTFTQTPYLKTHLRAHAGDLRFPCPDDTCGLFFLTRSQLVTHQSRFHGIQEESSMSFEQNSPTDTDQVSSMDPEEITGMNLGEEDTKSLSDVEIKIENEHSE